MNGRPKLKPCRVETISQAVVVTGDAGLELYLDSADRELLVLLDGTRDLRALFEDSFRIHGGASLRKILSLLRRLKEHQLLEPGFSIDKEEADSIVPQSFEPAFWSRLLWVKELTPHMRWPFKSRLLFFAISILCVALGTFVLATTFVPGLASSAVDFHSFLQVGGSYALSIPYGLVVSMGLIIAKSCLRLVLAGTLMGQLRSLRAGFKCLTPVIEASDSSVMALESRAAIVAFSLASALSYVFIAGLCRLFFPSQPWVDDVLALGIFLTFIDLDPYRDGDLTRLISHFYREDELRHLVPFLKNRALFSGLLSRSKAREEARYLLYTVSATAWVVGFLLFAETLIVDNYTRWFVTLRNGAGLEKFSVLFLVLSTLAVLSVLLFDLLGTITKNLFFPLVSRLLDFRRAHAVSEISSFDRDRLVEKLAGSPLFSGLPTSSLGLVAAGGRVRAYKKGTPLIVQGMVGEEMFVLLEGEVEIAKRELSGLRSHVIDLGPGSVFGETALIRKERRTADVTAKTDLRTFVISRPQFEALWKEELAVARTQLEDQIALSTLLSSSFLFHDLPKETLGLFLKKGQITRVQAGTDVVTQGARDTSFFVVIRGVLDVLQDGHRISRIEQGSCFGEIALFTKGPRTATVRSVGESVLLKLDSDAFWSAVSSHAGLAVRLEVIAEQRMERAG